GYLLPFYPHISGRIAAALGSRQKHMRYTTSNKVSITVDFKSMKRINMDTKKESDIVIEIPCQHAINQIEVAFGHRQLLSTLVEDLCGVNFMRSVINKKTSPYKIESVVKNEHAARGSMLFSRFVDAVEKKTIEIPDLLGEIVDLVLKRGRFVGKSRIQYGFHGTPPRNLSFICEKGMNPNLRRSRALDYFGLNASTNMPYCAKEGPLPSESLKLLVFLLLLPNTGRLSPQEIMLQ
ncbi:hypothetical protein KI387_031088, partial [Taxus chinensis]